MWRLGGLVGLALLLAALVTGLSTERFIHTASHADGAVVALSAGGSHPRVSFRTADGRAALFSGGGLIFGYRVGQPASALRRANAPARTAILAAWGSLWFAPFVLGVIGSGWLVGALGRRAARPA